MNLVNRITGEGRAELLPPFQLEPHFRDKITWNWYMGCLGTLKGLKTWAPGFNQEGTWGGGVGGGGGSSVCACENYKRG